MFAEGDTLAEQMERGRSEEWLRPILALLSLCCEMPGSLLRVVDLRAWTMRLECADWCFLGVEKSTVEVSERVPENDLAGSLFLSVPQAEIRLQTCCSKACRYSVKRWCSKHMTSSSNTAISFISFSVGFGMQQSFDNWAAQGL